MPVRIQRSKKTKPHLVPLKLPIEENDKRISAEKSYLVQYLGQWQVGYFVKQWYGWNFQAFGDGGIQVDYYGWDAIYEFVEPPEKKKKAVLVK